VARHPSNAEGFYNLGMTLKQQDKFVEAEEALRKAIALDPKLAEAPYTLGVVLWQTGRLEEAERFLRDALALDPSFTDAHVMLGTVLRQRGARDAAIAEFRAAIAARPTLAEAHLNLGQLLQQAGDREGAAAALAEHARLNQRKADAQASTFAVGVGRELLKKQNVTAAVAKFREAIKLAPENPHAHFELAMALRRQGQEQEARAHFVEAQRLAPWLRPPQ